MPFPVKQPKIESSSAATPVIKEFRTVAMENARVMPKVTRVTRVTKATRETRETKILPMVRRTLISKRTVSRRTVR